MRVDRRQRRHEDGSTTVHPPETWEECYEFLVELEEISAGSRELAQSRVGALSQAQPHIPG
eukprot:1394593-Karenia_brevis.AAC.1